MATPLPSAQQNFISGQTQPIDAARPTDGGLGALAEGVDQYQQGANRIAEMQARKAVGDLREAYESGYQQDAAALTVDKAPNFATTQRDRYDTLAAKQLATLHDPQAQAYFAQMSGEYRGRLLSMAGERQGQVLGAYQQQAQTAAQQARVGLVATNFQLGTRTMLEQDAQGNAPLQPGYADSALARFDDRAKSTLDATPDIDKPMLQLRLAEQRDNLALNLQQQSIGLTEEQTRRSVQDGLQGIVNHVKADPTYRDQALLDGGQLIATLPVQARGAVAQKWPDTVLQSIAEGMVARKDYSGLSTFLDSKDPQAHMDATAYGRYLDLSTSTAVAGQMALDQQTAEKGLQNEVASLMETGKSTGLDTSSFVKAFGPIEGPVKKNDADQQIAVATRYHDIIKQASSMSEAEFDAQLKLMMPAQDDPNYARDLALQKQAEQLGQQMFQRQRTDPAGSDITDPASAAKWRGAMTGQAGSAQAWGDYTTARQTRWGIPQQLQRILPNDYAKATVTEINKAAPNVRDTMLMQLRQTVDSYGQYGGQVLKEFQDAGLSGPDAAALHLAGNDPAFMGRYVRAQEVTKGGTPPTKDQKANIERAVDAAFAPFQQTQSYSTQGSIMADNARRVVATMTQAGVHDGESPEVAAREATKWLFQGAQPDQKGTYLVPQSIQAEQVKRDFNAVPTPNLFNPHPTAFDAVHMVGTVDGATALRNGLYATVRDYALDPSKLAAPGLEAWMTPEQKQQRYANKVADQAFWINGGDAGMKTFQLVMKDENGQTVIPVKDNKGQPIVRTWDQVKSRITGGK
jgi:hypothetical protein